MKFVCPICGCGLAARDNRAVCERGHSFDRAKEGYYNLILNQKKGNHGDNAEMVLARRAFLGADHYRPLAQRVAELVAEHTPACGDVLDAGCGEGYYTDIAERMLSARDGESRVCAFDISRDAVRRVAKRNSGIALAVAGSYHMPFADSAFDTVMNTFSPLALSETLRVLKEGGIFVMAIPGEDHLFELKSVIYDTPYKNTVADTALEGFELLSDEPLRFVMHLCRPEDIRALFEMTPYAYRTREEDKARVYALSEIDCTADFRIFVYKKRAGAKTS